MDRSRQGDRVDVTLMIDVAEQVIRGCDLSLLQADALQLPPYGAKAFHDSAWLAPIA